MSAASGSSSSSNAAAAILATAKAAIQKAKLSNTDQKILNAMLDNAPSSAGQQNVAFDIISTKPADLSDLAQHYWTAIVLPIQGLGGRRPAFKNNPAHTDGFGGRTPLVPKRAVRNQATIKQQTLNRDSFRCAISGRIDPLETLHRPSTTSGSSQFETTEAAHVLPFSLCEFEDKPAEKQQMSRIWTAIQAFCGEDLSALANNINTLDNVLTLCHTAHKFFGDLSVGLTPLSSASSSTQTTYRLTTFGMQAPHLSLFPSTVQISKRLANAPNPVYLALHCAVCRVYWASGLARSEDLSNEMATAAEVEATLEAKRERDGYNQ